MLGCWEIPCLNRLLGVKSLRIGVNRGSLAHTHAHRTILYIIWIKGKQDIMWLGREILSREKMIGGLVSTRDVHTAHADKIIMHLDPRSRCITCERGLISLHKRLIINMPCFLYKNDIGYIEQEIQYNQPSFSPTSLFSYLYNSKPNWFYPSYLIQGRKFDLSYSIFFLFTYLRSIACSH